MANRFKIRRGSVAPNNSADIENYELVYNYTNNELWTKHNGSVVKIASGATGTVTNVVAGNGLTGGGTSTATLDLDFSELTDLTSDISGSTEFILQDGTTESRKAASEIKLSAFNNDLSLSSGTVTSVTAGTGATQSGTNTVNPTINVVGENGLAASANAIGLDFDPLSAVGSNNLEDEDLFAVEIAVGGAIKKLTASDLKTYIGGSTITSVSGMTNNNVLTASGSTTINGESALTFGGSNLKLLVDSGKFLAGANEDAYFMHSGSHAWLNNSTGNLYIRNQTDDGQIIMQTDNGSGGTTTYMSLKGNEQLIRFLKSTRHNDGVVGQFGTSSDLRIYHNAGGSSNIENHSGDLYFTEYTDDGSIYFRSDNGSGGVTPYLTLDGNAGNLNFNNKALVAIGGLYGNSGTLNMYNDTYYFKNASSGVIMSLNGSTLDLPNTGDWSFIKNNTNSGGLRFGTKDSGGTYANQIEISNTGNYVKLNENTTVTGTMSVSSVFYGSQIDLTGELNFTGNGNKIIDVETLEGNNSFRIRNHNTVGNVFHDALKLVGNGGAFLYYNNGLRLETTSAGATISGNIAVTGTVDGRDVASDGSKLDGIESGATADQTITLTGDVTGSGSGSFATTVVDNSHNHHSITSNTGDPGDSRLQYWQANSNTTLNPNSNWFTAIRMGHGDPVTYYSNTIAVQMTGTGTGDLYTRNIASGTAGSWFKHWNDGNDGSGSGLDADLLDGNHASAFLTSSSSINATTLDNYDSTRFFRRQGSATATVGPGWMTVATNTSGRRAGEILVTDADSGDHAFIRIHWLRSYADSNFTVINCGGHGNAITGARVLSQDSDNTYGEKILQVYVDRSSSYDVKIFLMGDDAHYSEHTVHTPTIENTITGYSLHGNQLEDLDTYGFAHEEGIQAGGVIKTQSNMEAVNITASNRITAERIDITESGTVIGDIQSTDSTWLRLNQSTNKNIYTPRYIRADSGFFVDGASQGITGAGVFRAPNGSASIPTYSFSNDTDLGFYRKAADQIGFATAGEEQMYLADGSLHIAQPVRFQFANDQRIFDNGSGGLSVGAESHELRLYSGGTDPIEFRMGGRNGTTRCMITYDGQYHWGSGAGHGTLTWDTGKAILTSQSGNTLELRSQNATDMIAIEDNVIRFIADGTERFRASQNGLDLSNNTATKIVHNAADTRDKYRVWTSSFYAIGMQSAITFGGLNDYGMTFQMNSDDDRGFWWGDSSHGKAAGAMALTTNGKLTVANSMRIGYGESDTTTPGGSYALDVSGHAYASSSFLGPNGSAGTPSYRFHNDGNTGMYRGASDTIDFSNGGIRMLTIQADGDLELRSDGSSQGASIHRIGGLYFTWDRDSYGTNQQHAILCSSDDLIINSFDNVTINIDSNNNDTAEAFQVRRHGIDLTSGELLYSIDQTGNSYTMAASQVGNGSAAAPSLSFYNDTDLGFYRNGANNMRFSAGNAIRGTWNGDGLVLNGGSLGVNVAIPTTDGVIRAGNDVIAYYSSDKRLKENIKPIENAVDKVSKIRGVEFDWIVDKQDSRYRRTRCRCNSTRSRKSFT
jgi:hypothetical protein